MTEIARIIISPACRAGRGVDGAFDEAVRQAREAYDRYAGRDKFSGRDWHLVLHRDDPE